MIESPATLGELPYAGEDLRGFRFHTGAPLRPLAPDEPCPILFRDLGPVALARFLRGTLPRLAGPLSPVTYLRTAAFTEPYTDYEATGRIVLLRPLLLRPWHSGVPEVFVSRAAPGVDRGTIAFVPGSAKLPEVARRASSMREAGELREELGGRAYDEEVTSALHRLDRLGEEQRESEEAGAPLRRRLQSRDAGERRGARLAMERHGITESDLCAAFHHLPRERRRALGAALPRAAAGLLSPWNTPPRAPLAEGSPASRSPTIATRPGSTSAS